MSFEEVFKHLLERLGSECSRVAYRKDWERYLDWASAEGVDVLTARPRHIEAHLNALAARGCKRSTCGRALSVIRKVYGAFVREEMIEKNPAREVENLKIDDAPKTPYLGQDEARKLLSVPAETWEEKRDRLCVRLLIGLGWRRSEVARMRIEHFHDGTVTGIVKGSKRLTVGVPKWLQDDITEWLTDTGIKSGPLLPRAADDARPMTADMVYQHVVRVGRRAGVTINPHGLRRTNITLTGERGVSLKERQLAVGHSSSGTTERYDRARDASASAPGQTLVDLVEEKK